VEFTASKGYILCGLYDKYILRGEHRAGRPRPRSDEDIFNYRYVVCNDGYQTHID